MIASPSVYLNMAAAPLNVQGVGRAGWMAPRVLAPEIDNVEVPGLGVAFVLVPGAAASVCK